MSPCIPSGWREYSIRYKFGESVYNIKVFNPDGKVTGIQKFLLDGREIESKEIRLDSSGGIYSVEVFM